MIPTPHYQTLPMYRLLNLAATVLLVVAAISGSTHAQDNGTSIRFGSKQTLLELVHIPRGKFQQGSPANEPGRKDDESQRMVEISNDFLMGKYPVTVRQFREFVDATNYKTEAEKGSSGGFGWDGTKLTQKPEFNWHNPGFPIAEDHPVCLVTVADANAFLAWLSKQTNVRFSLPTEAQWEYACRANTQTRFYNGDADSDSEAIGWTQENTGEGTHTVGTKTPNAFGLYDMAGNVFEWCADIYAPYPSDDARDPLQTTAPQGAKVRNVLRGGSWLRKATFARSAARYQNDPKSRNADNGFRVCALLNSEFDKATFQSIDGKATEKSSNSTSTPSTPPPPNSNITESTSSNTNFPSAPSATPSEAMDPTSRPESRQGTSALSILAGLGCVCIVPMVLLFILITKMARPLPTNTDNSFASDARQTGQIIGMMQGVLNSDSNANRNSDRDGFWLDTNQFPIGTVVLVQCYVQSRIMQQNVQVESHPQQFVYTGGVPQNITVTPVSSDGSGPNADPYDRDIMPPTNQDFNRNRNRQPPHDPWTDRSTGSNDSTGYPPAY